MQKLPALRKEGAAPAWQVERLSRWFSEWKLHTILDDEPGPDGSPGSPGKADLVGLVNAYEPAIESGQLRLLAPRGKVTSARPIYVAVLEQPGRGHYLCAPFGRFSEPALPGELRLLQDVPALRVLCVWNAVVLPEESLAGSWHVGALDSDALGAVTAVRAYLDRGHQLGCPSPVSSAAVLPFHLY